MDRISKALEMARQGAAPEPRMDVASERTELAFRRSRTVALSREHLRDQRIIAGFSDDPLAGGYRVLRTRLLQSMEQNGWRTLGVTSAGPKEGKTLTAINLSLSIARELNHSVLLVDADLRRPSVHHRLGIRPEHGLSDYLLHGIPVEQVLVQPDIDRFSVLPGKNALPDSSERLASREMVELVNQVRSRYSSRLVVFDLPPVLVADDVVAFAPCLDAVLLVIQEGKTSEEELNRTIELLDGVELAGTVLNKSMDGSQAYDYYYN